MSTAYSYVINQIKKRKEIPINMIEKINIEPDYNCLFRSFSYYLLSLQRSRTSQWNKKGYI